MLHWMEHFNRLLGRFLAWVTTFVVLLVFALTVLRYAFDLNWISLQELAQALHALAFMLAMGWVLQQDEHVRVDIFYRKLGPRGQARVNFFGTLLLLLPAMGFLFWISLDYVAASWRILEGSREAGGLPGVFLLKTLIPAMAVLLLLQGLHLLARNARLAFGGAPR